MIEKIYTVENDDGTEVHEGTANFSEARAEAEAIGGVVVEHEIEETGSRIVEDFSDDEGGSEDESDDDED
jgi:hypothetical protein